MIVNLALFLTYLALAFLVSSGDISSTIVIGALVSVPAMIVVKLTKRWRDD